MEQFLQNFHFQRLYWFVALIPAAVLLVLLWRRKKSSRGFSDLIDSHLLSHLLLNEAAGPYRLPFILLGLVWLLMIFALAGPVWRELPQPMFELGAKRVFILDLSQSMLIKNDPPPDRLSRARFKLTDALERSREGQTALVVFAGDAHIVTPLTDDTATIEALISSLSPEIMPVAGDSVTEALLLAQQLLERGGGREGAILLFSDGISDVASAMPVVAQLKKDGTQLSVIGVLGRNTADGMLRALARYGGGSYSRISASDSDLDKISSALAADPRQSESMAVEGRSHKRWSEDGAWLLLPILLLAVIAFRRNYLLLLVVALPLSIFCYPVSTAQAFTWQDIWLTQNQQAARSLEDGDASVAAEKFTDPAWRAAARYQNGDYEKAAHEYSLLDEPDDKDVWYNMGNALAQAGRLQEAVVTYELALELDPGMEDAQVNLEIVRELLEQEKKKESGDSGSGQKPDDKEKQPESEQKDDGEDEQQEGNQQEQDRKENQQQQRGDSGNSQKPDDKKKQLESEQSDNGEGEPQGDNQQKHEGNQQQQSGGSSDQQQNGKEEQSESGQGDTGGEQQEGSRQDHGGNQPLKPEDSGSGLKQNDKEEQQEPDQKDGSGGKPKERRPEDGGRDQAKPGSLERRQKTQGNEHQPRSHEQDEMNKKKTEEGSEEPGQGKGQSVEKKPEDEENQDTSPTSGGSQDTGKEQNEVEFALEQWLRQIPDDPAGLMRRKFKLETIRRQMNR